MANKVKVLYEQRGGVKEFNVDDSIGPETI